MKTKLSITLDEETVSKIEEHVINGIFRNKSHAIEFALIEMIKNKKMEEN